MSAAKLELFLLLIVSYVGYLLLLHVGAREADRKKKKEKKS